MRMLFVSVIGLAGLVGLFAYCEPLRDRARSVVLGQEVVAPSEAVAVPAGAEASGKNT